MGSVIFEQPEIASIRLLISFYALEEFERLCVHSEWLDHIHTRRSLLPFVILTGFFFGMMPGICQNASTFYCFDTALSPVNDGFFFMYFH